MRIVHICLACFYKEGWGYQENIFPKYHVRQGHEVMVLTSDCMPNNQGEQKCKAGKAYTNQDGVSVKVLEKSNRYGWYSKFRDYKNVYKELEAFEPDLVFVHGGQFVALKDVIAYCKRHKQVKLFMDQHGDYYNTPVNTFRRKFVAKIIFGYWIRKAAKLAQKLWGVTPWRCQYLHDVYGVPKEKIGLLVMGGDDEAIPFDRAAQLREEIRKTLGIPQDAFVAVTGGKIDQAKNIHLLAQAVSEIDRDDLHLIIFGKPNAEMAAAMAAYGSQQHCHSIGWLDASCVYDYFLASDLAVFPGTHSVLWEQACACGVPMLVKDWEGMRHVCVNGNAGFLYEDSVAELKQNLLRLLEDPHQYKNMKDAARACMKNFLYSEISKRAIEADCETVP